MRAIPTPRSVTWAQEIYTIGIYSSKYFLGPKNRSWGAESRGGQQRQALRELGAEAAAERGGDGGPRARERREADGDVHDRAAASAGAVHVRHAVDVHLCQLYAINLYNSQHI